MTIIGGYLRGRKLKAPPGKDLRPTTSRVREALFNLVEARMHLDNARVLDLFAGTGSLAIEALSRGATQATLVEQSVKILRYTRRNCQLLGLESQCHIKCMDAKQYVRRFKSVPFDLILADPPYQLSRLAELPDQALQLVRPNGLFVLEHDASTKFDDHPALLTSREYGRTRVTLFGT